MQVATLRKIATVFVKLKQAQVNNSMVSQKKKKEIRGNYHTKAYIYSCSVTHPESTEAFLFSPSKSLFQGTAFQ